MGESKLEKGCGLCRKGLGGALCGLGELLWVCLGMMHEFWCREKGCWVFGGEKHFDVLDVLDVLDVEVPKWGRWREIEFCRSEIYSGGRSCIDGRAYSSLNCLKKFPIGKANCYLGIIERKLYFLEMVLESRVEIVDCDIKISEKRKQGQK